MPDLRLNTTVFVLLAIVPVPLLAQQPAESPRDLVRDMVYNELHDRERDSHWEYRSQCVSSEKNVVREQVETDDGPIFRILERNGTPLDAEQRHQEDERLASYINDPGQIARVRRGHQEDEQRMGQIVALLPQAFLFAYEPGGERDTVRIGFRPDPAFVPSGYEARIVHALTGTLTVDTRRKRMIDMRGVLSERVEFGYGLLGHVEKGGTFEIHRRQVSAARWKTDLVEVHIQGKVLLFHNVTKDQREARSDFRAVPSGTTLVAADAMLAQATGQTAEARMVPAE